MPPRVGGLSAAASTKVQRLNQRAVAKRSGNAYPLHTSKAPSDCSLGREVSGVELRPARRKPRRTVKGT